MDSGADTTSELVGGRPIYSQSFVTGENTSDWFGHGDHVAGIIAGTGSGSTGPEFSYKVRGIAPKARIINLKALNENGYGSDATVIAAITRAIQLKSTYNIKVMNLPLGRPVRGSYKTDPLCMAVEAAWKAGIVVVVAAGNEGRNNSLGTQGYGTIMSPGNDPYVITVGAMITKGSATRSDDVMTSFSSKGPTIILTRPY